MTTRDYLLALETEIAQLKSELPEIFIDEKDADVFESFFAESEFSLALEEVTGRLIERKVAVPLAVYKRIERLATKLEIPDAHWKSIKIIRFEPQ